MARLRQRIGDLGQILLRSHLTGQNQAEEQKRAFAQQDKIRQAGLTDKLTEASINNPEASDQLFELAKQMGVVLPDAARASNEDLLKKARASISPTTSDSDITNSLKTLGRGLGDSEGVLPPEMGEGPSNTNPTIQELMKVRAERTATRDSEVKRELGITEDKAKAQAHGQMSGTNQAKNENWPIELQHIADEMWTKEPIETQGAADKAGAEFDAQHTPGRIRAGANAAGANAGATAAAQAPYSKPEEFFNDKGDSVPVRFGPKGATVVPGLPPGLTRQQPPKLAPTQMSDLALSNEAEVQGVKVLSQLHNLGLDQSNDPTDPRWTQFVSSTLKMAPGDIERTDINQRVAYIRAAIQRSLQGGRGGKWLAEEYGKHLADPQQSGELLTHILTNSLEENAGKRRELEALMKQNPGAYGPRGGMTLEQYQQLLQDAPPATSPLDSARQKKSQLGGGGQP